MCVACSVCVGVCGVCVGVCGVCVVGVCGVCVMCAVLYIKVSLLQRTDDRFYQNLNIIT